METVDLRSHAQDRESAKDETFVRQFPNIVLKKKYVGLVFCSESLLTSWIYGVLVLEMCGEEGGEFGD